MKRNAQCKFKALLPAFCVNALIFGIILTAASCTQLQKPAVDAFYSETAAPQRQEFRWSNGRSPRSLDPALAAAAPERDIVRAIYEGLTEIDPRTLYAVPAVAEKWSSAENSKVWTFKLRDDARWSNGQNVTANDFVAEFKRLASLGTKAANYTLFSNIRGMSPKDAAENEVLIEPELTPPGTPSAAPENNGANFHRFQDQTRNEKPAEREKSPASDTEKAEPFGVRAVDDATLEITLIHPDKDLPKLLADPLFRPVFRQGKEFEADTLNDEAVTNGAFEIAAIDGGAVTLARSDTYWGRDSVKLDRVYFIPKDSSDAALEAYRSGELDVVTNANFEPLALKLLAPFKDFRQTTHSALNFYEVNTRSGPLADRRVREALAISIDREQIVDGELQGSMQPAATFLAVGGDHRKTIAFDPDRAADLMTAAGFPSGEGFPTLRLVINRNDTQQRVAKTVTRMWKTHLNIDAEIIVKEAAELDEVRKASDFDLIRRGVLLPTSDEFAGLSAIFGTPKRPRTAPPPAKAPVDIEPRPSAGEPLGTPDAATPQPDGLAEAPISDILLSESSELYDLKAIPLYFPTSQSLIKPYVIGFEVNALDAPLLSGVSINNNWNVQKQ